MQIGAAGELIAIWKAQDTTLDASTFRLAYRSAPSLPWQPVVVQQPAPTQADASGIFEGRQTWTVATDARDIEVRAEVVDRAGNASLETRHLSLVNNAIDQGRKSHSSIGDSPSSTLPSTTRTSSASARSWTDTNEPPFARL